MTRALVPSFLVAVILAAIPAGTAGAATYPTGFEERTVVSGLTAPTGVAWAPDGRIFVVEKEGKLKVVPPGGSAATTILNISNRVNHFHDRGMLGIAVDSNYASNNYVYLLYTYDLTPLTADSNGQMVSRLGRFTVSGSNVVSAETPILGTRVSGVCPAPANNVDCIPSEGLSHSIGTVRSAPDGTLWVGSGDAASYSAVDPLALRTYNEQSLAGKIMHVDRDGRGITGHPFCPTNANLAHVCTKLWAKGFRNPYRFTLRPGGGLVVGDVGWSTREEVDLVGAGGKNYGWPCYEGTMRTSGYRDRAECAAEYAKEGTANADVYPVHDYLHQANSAVLGGPTYTGNRYPAAYSGDIFFGDYAAGFLKRLKLDASGNVSSVIDFATDLFAVDVELNPDGELAYVSYGDGSTGTGSIRRIVHTAANRSPTAVMSATPTNGPPPLAVSFNSTGSSDPDGDTLTYQWDFGDGATATGPTASHTYSTAGNYTARLTVNDGNGGTDTKLTLIAVGGSPPLGTITAPAAGTTYRDSQAVSISGTGTDAQDGTLPASAFRWTVRLFHDDHMHPITSFDGVRSATFTTLDDHDANSYYEISLTVTDSSGLSDTKTVRIDPQTVTYTINSVPVGAPVTYAGVTSAAPMGRTSAIGFKTTISAADRFTSGGRDWVFSSWSDGGARQHNVTIPATDTTVTARYTDAGPSNLVAAYGFEEGAGSTVADASGRGNNGTISGATWSTTGRFGKALNFDGINDWVTVADASSLDLTSTLTVSGWIKADNPDLPWQVVALKEAPGQGGLAYALYATSTSPFSNAWFGNFAAWAPAGHRLAAGNWVHLAVTSDGTTLRLYIDGTVVDARPAAGAAPAGTGPLRMGGTASWADEWFDGLIDEVRVYNRALSATEIAADRNTPVGGAAPGDTTAPTVSISQPAAGATVQGSVTVAANASDNVGVGSVQFRVDGQNVGSADSTSPYGVSWDSTTVGNGSHSLTAVAVDAAGNSTTSAAVQVTVNNAGAPAGLVAAYGFEEGTGTTVGDRSGRGNAGTISGAAWSTTGRFGKALNFDGVNDWVTVADSASLDLTSAMTIDAWVRSDNPSRAWQPVVLKEDPGNGGLGYALYATSSGHWPNAWWFNDGVYAPVGSVLPAATWTHLAVTADGTTVRLYMNGTQVASRPVTGPAPAGSGPLRLGGDSVWPGEFFDGMIDEVRVYNRALSAGEIATDRDTPVG